MEITTYTSCLSEWKSQTSKHLKVSECDAKSFLLYHKYANTELQTTYLCTQNGGEGLEICLEVLRQLVNYSLIYLVLCLNKWWNDIASRHTLSLGQKKTAAENKWKKNQRLDCKSTQWNGDFWSFWLDRNHSSHQSAVVQQFASITINIENREASYFSLDSVQSFSLTGWQLQLNN